MPLTYLLQTNVIAGSQEEKQFLWLVFGIKLHLPLVELTPGFGIAIKYAVQVLQYSAPLLRMYIHDSKQTTVEECTYSNLNSGSLLQWNY